MISSRITKYGIECVVCSNKAVVYIDPCQGADSYCPSCDNFQVVVLGDEQIQWLEETNHKGWAEYKRNQNDDRR